jgi:hypothetical protein
LDLCEADRGIAQRSSGWVRRSARKDMPRGVDYGLAWHGQVEPAAGPGPFGGRRDCIDPVTDIESEPPDGADHRSAGALTTVSGSRHPPGGQLQSPGKRNPYH